MTRRRQFSKQAFDYTVISGGLIIGGEPTRTSVADELANCIGWAASLPAGSRGSYGEAMSDRAALIEAQIPGLRRFAGALLRGDRERADDLVQDTLERALSRWHLRRTEGNVRGWLYTILYNRFLTEQSRLRRRGVHGTLNEETELLGIVGGQDSALEHRDLLRAFSTLPEEQRAVLLLIGVEDLSYEEAARVLGVPIGTVMSRLSRGRERLRQHMYGDLGGSNSRRGAALRKVR
jgi:RNA polymerase sigma-70 factor (ECF subfamily)